MVRLSANIVFISPTEYIKNGFIEVDENNILTDLFSLDEVLSEPSSTQFLNGILVPFHIKEKNLLINKDGDLQFQLEETNPIQIKKGDKVSFWFISGEGLFCGNFSPISISQII
ncbi:MAG: hypothetical protein M0P12_07685 [Paludibacteraceae bacterium]|nr:hypothetical protein [Paludibacteraceae bacterium]